MASSARRTFLKLAAAGAWAGFYGFPVRAAEPPRVKGPNARWRIGAIGLRYQGSVITREATAFGDVVALCDVDRHVREQARASFGSTAAIFDDYRDLSGQFDKLVRLRCSRPSDSNITTRSSAPASVTSPSGAALLQLITMNDQDFHTSCRGTTDWIQTYIFPGSELGSLAEIHRSLGRVTRFRPFHMEEQGWHYALTLRAWRARFNDRLDEVRRLGMDDRFIRMWDLYLAYCEAGFAERHISDVQLLLTRAHHDGAYFSDPGATPQICNRVTTTDFV